jgi:hypothetical protein
MLASSTKARSIIARRSCPTLWPRRFDISINASAQTAGSNKPISTTSAERAPPIASAGEAGIMGIGEVYLIVSFRK